MKKQLPQLQSQFMQNWVYKLVALIVALTIWVSTLHSRKDFVYAINLNIDYVLRSNLTVNAGSVKNLKVKVSGTRAALKKITQHNHSVTFNLSQESIGKKTIIVKQSDLNLPLGVKFISVEPEKFEVEVEEVNL